MKKIPGLDHLPASASYDEMDSPVGNLIIITSEKGLHAILWQGYRESTQIESVLAKLPKRSNTEILLNTKQQLKEYFKGQRKKFELPLVMQGTEFQIQCWKVLQKIPYGKTFSYAKQAEMIGDKKKARAVGMANGVNPISIVVPCHRVIGSNGKLVGFGGGLSHKEYLLNLECAD